MRKSSNWDVLRNNCAHLSHNVLAVAGLWPEIPTNRPLLIAAFDFPVPKNEFVDMMRRTNDMPITDPDAMYDDPTARASIMREDLIPTRPGGLAEAERAVQGNEVYNTDLRLIFYDEPIFGHYPGTIRSNIQREPLYGSTGEPEPFRIPLQRDPGPATTWIAERPRFRGTGRRSMFITVARSKPRKRSLTRGGPSPVGCDRPKILNPCSLSPSDTRASPQAHRLWSARHPGGVEIGL